jgi:hypothetical protein
VTPVTSTGSVQRPSFPQKGEGEWSVWLKRERINPAFARWVNHLPPWGEAGGGSLLPSPCGDTPAGTMCFARGTAPKAYPGKRRSETGLEPENSELRERHAGQAAGIQGKVNVEYE